MTTVLIDVLNAKPGSLLLAPTGITTSQGSVSSTRVAGSRIVEVLLEPELCSEALLLEAEEKTVQLTHRVSPTPRGAAYPESAFAPRSNRHIEPSEELVLASREIASAAGGGSEGIGALVAEAEARFCYAHPEIRFNDAIDKVPYLSCGLTPGSCIDINTYLVASLRAAGYEAGYIYGYFFSRERNGKADDMHCWVVTRHNGQILEWDIAHHIKAGLGKTRPGLNPRPGQRVALGHSFGHHYTTSEGRQFDLKMLATPVVLSDSGNWDECQMRVRLVKDDSSHK